MRCRILSIPLLLVIMLGALATSAAAATRYVAVTGSDEGNNDCLSMGSPCRTVQHGIDEAESGDTVSIGSGTFKEELTVDKALTMVGQGPASVLEGDSTVKPAVKLLSDAGLRNLRVRGGNDEEWAAAGVVISGNGITDSFNGVTVEQAPVETDGTNAVSVGYGSALKIEGSTVVGTVPDALMVNGSAEVIDSSISVAAVRRSADAIFASSTATVEVSGSTITNSDVVRDVGAVLMSEGATVTATDSTFTGPLGIWVSPGSASIARDKIEANEVGLLLQEGATAEMRDSLISPTPGGNLTTDALVNPSETPATLTIVGSTLYAEGSGRFLSGPRAVEVGPQEGPVSVRISNSILRAVEPGTAGMPLDIANGAAGATWSITHSDFTTRGFGAGLPEPGSGSNVATVPVFAGQVSGDYRLTDADAPLLAVGDPNQVTPGETDLASEPRAKHGGCNGSLAPDLGAYELIRDEPCPSPPGGEVARGPQSSSAGEGVKSPSRPRITGLKVVKRSKGPILQFTLSVSGRIRVRIVKVIPRGVGKGKKASHRVVATLTDEAHEGPGSIRLGALGSHKLTPGLYRLTILASAGGLRSATRNVAFSLRGD